MLRTMLEEIDHAKESRSKGVDSVGLVKVKTGPDQENGNGEGDTTFNFSGAQVIGVRGR